MVRNRTTPTPKNVLTADDWAQLVIVGTEEELCEIIKQNLEFYERMYSRFVPMVVKDGLDYRKVGELIGVMASADRNLSLRMNSRGIDPKSLRGYEMRALFGMKVIEDP